MAARSVNCALVNLTGESLTLTNRNLDHGIFPPGQEPPVTAGDGRSIWYSESAGVMTGTEGTATYGGPNGTVSVHWNNPFAGGNSFDASATGDYHIVSVSGPKTGSNVSVAYSVERKTKTEKPFADPPTQQSAIAPNPPDRDQGPEDHRNDAHVPIFHGSPTTLSVKRWLVDVAWEVVDHLEWSEQLLEITENRHGEQGGAKCPGTLPKWADVKRSGVCGTNHAHLKEVRTKDNAAKVEKYKSEGKTDAEAKALAAASPLFNDFHSWCGDYVTWVFWKAWVLKGKPETKITKAQLAQFLNREALSGAWKPGKNLIMIEEHSKMEGNGYLVWHEFGDGYVPQPGDIMMANRDNGGHIAIVGSFDTNPLYRENDKGKKRPYFAYVTLNGKSFDDGYLKKGPAHDAAGWNRQGGWSEESQEHHLPSLTSGQHGVAQAHLTTAQKGERNFAALPYARAFIDTSRLREALGYR